ncbi:MAG: hypothetical protein DRJ47_02495 [Thermoprotei archaeon]|nr:MAG: hypothetical protein DRJ47_02495 [Thermoprotei archaeon]
MKRTYFLYVEENSPLYKLHPSLKIFLLLFFNIEALLLDSPYMLWGGIILTILLFKVAKIPLSRLGKFLAFAIIITQAIMFSYLLGSSIPGNIVYWHLPWGTYVTDVTLLHVFTMVGRFMLMLVGSTLVLSVLTDTDIIYGLVFLRVPYSIALTISLAFRFASIFLDDYLKVRDAMVLRGTSFDKGNIFQRARKYVNLAIPLMVMAIRRMLELTYVLEVKGTRLKGKRTFYREYKMKPYEKALAILLLATPALTLTMKMGLITFILPGVLAQ